MAHAILLIQISNERTFAQFESVAQCLTSGVTAIFEEHLRVGRPDEDAITYLLQDLFDFIDSLDDIRCFVFHEDSSDYIRHDKEWIKDKIYVLRSLPSVAHSG